MSSTRREFLAQSMGATTLLATGSTLPGFLTRTASASTRGVDDPILVVVQLTGGNDGLNTVIPFRNDRYHRARPTLRVNENQVHELNDELGLHPDMGAFKSLYDDGLLSVVTNTGYPNPDRSHFRSMDIWHTATVEPERADDGWLGRVVDRSAGAGDVPMALHLDNDALPMALHTQQKPVMSVQSIESFTLAAGGDEIAPTIAAAREAATEDLMYVQRIAVSSCANAKRLERIVQEETSVVQYPPYGLARRLRQIAQLIGADFGARIFYTSIGGFDTHARQMLAHGPLLRELSESVSSFQQDLQQRGLAERVMLMTFSEFGRRVNENGSRGTDHGAAAPMFIVGQACKPGVIGNAPNLAHLEQGDVPHEIDFRQVYAALLDDWLGVDHQPILGEAYKPVQVLRERG